MDEELLKADRLLTVDLVDQAEAIYRRIAAEEPRNVDAMVGMARCALARADDHEAYRLAAWAHALDASHDMARRMEARLYEVLATRGEQPGAGPGVPFAGDGPAAPAKAADEPRRSLFDRRRGR